MCGSERLIVCTLNSASACVAAPPTSLFQATSVWWSTVNQDPAATVKGCLTKTEITTLALSLFSVLTL